MKHPGFASLALAGAALATVVTTGPANARELVIGFQCDRSGPTQLVGNYLCDGAHDYIRLANREGMFGEGNSVRAFEIDHGYNVPRGIEAYERSKESGHVTYGLYGTPHTYALTPKLTADKVPGTSPGFGSAGAANGKSYPYIFPVAATYWSQAGAAIQFIMDEWKASGQIRASQDRLSLLRQPGRPRAPGGAARHPGAGSASSCASTRFRRRAWTCARRCSTSCAATRRTGWSTTLFGKAPAVSIKELSRLRFPMNRVIGFVWAASEADMAAAGWEAAEGYQALQFAGVGQNHKVIDRIKAMYAEEGKPLPEKKMAVSVYYNRGVFIGALHARAIVNAIEAVGADNVTGDDVRKGFESISDFTLGGFMPPLNLTPEDHEGGGWVQVYQVRGGQWVPLTDWMQGYREVVMEHVARAEPPKG